MPDILGLSESADLAYRILLRRPGLTAAQLAAELGRPVSEAAGLLDALATAGLAVPAGRRPPARPAEPPAAAHLTPPPRSGTSTDDQAPKHYVSGRHVAGHQAAEGQSTNGHATDLKTNGLPKTNGNLTGDQLTNGQQQNGLPSATRLTSAHKSSTTPAATIARQTPGHPAPGYQAVAPDLAFGRLLDQREQDLRKGRAQLHRLMDVFRESTAVGRPDGLVELVSGGEAIDIRVRQLFDSARSQIRAFDRPPYLQTPGANLDYESRRLREGISYRILYSRDALAWPGRYKADIAAGCEAGEQARVRGTLPTKLLLADNHFALLPVAGADAPVDLAYAIRAPALLAALGALFEGEWERGIPLGSAAVRDEPDETSRSLLQLLAAGLTDTAIARELDWSPRTTQRRVKELFDRLGVATRFQAGVVARDRGWL